VQAHGESTREVANLVASVASHSRALVEAAELVGRSVGGLGSITRAVHALADRVARALEDQGVEGNRQREALTRLDGMLAEVGQAIERHGRVTAEVREALRRLTGTAQQHEGAVGALSGVAGRLGSHARTLGERLDRFKVGAP
jgi:methyl-accepting chemotaxis protein